MTTATGMGEAGSIASSTASRGNRDARARLPSAKAWRNMKPCPRPPTGAKMVVDDLTGVAPYAPPRALSGRRHTAPIPAPPARMRSEVSAGGYARVPARRRDGRRPMLDGISVNTTVITFGPATADWGTIYAFRHRGRRSSGAATCSARAYRPCRAPSPPASRCRSPWASCGCASPERTHHHVEGRHVRKRPAQADLQRHGDRQPGGQRGVLAVGQTSISRCTRADPGEGGSQTTSEVRLYLLCARRGGAQFDRLHASPATASRRSTTSTSRPRPAAATRRRTSRSERPRAAPARSSYSGTLPPEITISTRRSAGDHHKAPRITRRLHAGRRTRRG